MIYTFNKLGIGDVLTIKSWKYKEGYMREIYMKPYLENYARNKELKGPSDCDGFAVFKKKELFGLFEFYLGETFTIGLAIHPKFVGQGYAKSFIEEGIAFGVEYYKIKNDCVSLEVNINNIPAIKAYLKTGFIEKSRNDEEILMEYKL